MLQSERWEAGATLLAGCFCFFLSSPSIPRAAVLCWEEEEEEEKEGAGPPGNGEVGETAAVVL